MNDFVAYGLQCAPSLIPSDNGIRPRIGGNLATPDGSARGKTRSATDSAS